MRGGRRDESLWVQALILFETRGPGGRSARLARLRRPHGLIGRIVGADLPATEAAARHAYIHADERGVCLVDLATRSGTRVNGLPIDSAWLRVGDVVEVAGREFALREVRIDGVPFLPAPCGDRILSDADERSLSNLSLAPHRRRGSRWVVGSELIFLGRDAATGELRPGGDAAGRIHCALLRSTTCAFVVDLLSLDVRVNDRPVRGSARIVDGDVLTVGHDRLSVHIEPFSGEHPSISPRGAASAPGSALARIVPGPGAGDAAPAVVPELDDPRDAALAWMLGAIQVGHGELLRRQNELRDALGEALRRVQAESSSVMDSHLERIETLNDELESLRRRIESSEAAARAAPTDSAPTPEPSAAAPPPPPPPSPPAPLPGRPPVELVGPPAPVSEKSRESAAWLLRRIDDVEKQRRFSFRNLFKFGRSGDRDRRLDDFDQVNDDTGGVPDDPASGPTSLS